MIKKTILLIVAIAMSVLLFGPAVYMVMARNNDLKNIALKISESGQLDVYDKESKTVGYVKVQSATANLDELQVDVEGVLFVYVPEGCMSTTSYEWPRLSVACLNGTTTNYTLVTKYPGVRILTDIIEVIKK